MLTMFWQSEEDEDQTTVSRGIPATNGRERAIGLPLESWDTHAIFVRHCTVRNTKRGQDYVNMRKGDDHAVKKVLSRFVFMLLECVPWTLTLS